MEVISKASLAGPPLGEAARISHALTPYANFFIATMASQKRKKIPKLPGPRDNAVVATPYAIKSHTNLDRGAGSSARIYNLPHQNFELSPSDFALAELVQKELWRAKNTSFDNFSTEIDFWQILL